MKSYSFLSAVSLSIILLLASCKKDEIPPIPELTPESSFSMDFSDFQQNKSTNFLIENWFYSVTNVSFFSSIVSANMVIPTLAFTGSFNATPTYIGDQTWQWSYQFIGIGANYTARLKGITERKKIRWEMYIDKTGLNEFSNFLWFEGSTTDSTSASWTIYQNPTSPSALFDIAWKSNSKHTVSSLKYTYRKTGAENMNSTIEFGKNPDNTFDRYYTIFLAGTDASINIEWDSVMKNGRVKSPNHYKDETWHCWDETHFDDFCD